MKKIIVIIALICTTVFAYMIIQNNRFTGLVEQGIMNFDIEEYAEAEINLTEALSYSIGFIHSEKILEVEELIGETRELNQSKSSYLMGVDAYNNQDYEGTIRYLELVLENDKLRYAEAQGLIHLSKISLSNSSFEKGSSVFNDGKYESAIFHLSSVIEDDDNYFSAIELIGDANHFLAEEYYQISYKAYNSDNTVAARINIKKAMGFENSDKIMGLSGKIDKAISDEKEAAAKAAATKAAAAKAAASKAAASKPTSNSSTLGPGEYWCMGKNDTCQNKTYDPWDFYCDECDPDRDGIEN
ncbi:hypothetical protein JR334_07760 [Clostridia bacterium]|nr:hypothetical protein JR334_07760 [Clostridia bacterium]